MTFIRFPWEIYKGDRYWVLLWSKINSKNSIQLIPSVPIPRWHSFWLVKGKGRRQNRGNHRSQLYWVPPRKSGLLRILRILSWCGSCRNSSFKGRRLVERAWDGKNGRPINPSTNDECGLLIEGFDAPPCLMMPFNPRYYPPLLENFWIEEEDGSFMPTCWKSLLSISIVWTASREVEKKGNLNFVSAPSISAILTRS